MKRIRSISSLLTLCVMLVTTNAAVTEEVEARLNWHRKASLSLPVSGVVTDIKVSSGDKVKAGDVLIALDQRVFKAQADFAALNLKYQQRLNNEAKQELDRNIELYERTVLSNHELEAAHIQFEKSLAELSNALLLSAQAEFNLQYSKIIAPFDGVVVVQNATQGQTVVSEQTAPLLVELAATDAMAAEFVITGSSLRKLKNGQKVDIWIGKSKVKGVISEIAYEPLPNSNRYVAKARFDTKGSIYRVGRKVKVVLP